MAKSIKGGEGKLDRVSNFHVADPTGTRTHLRQSLDSRYRPHSLTLLSFRLPLLASGHGGFPSGPRHLVAITAGMRCGLLRSVTRLDQDYLTPGPHATHSLIAPAFGLVSFKVCYRPGDSQSI